MTEAIHEIGKDALVGQGKAQRAQQDAGRSLPAPRRRGLASALIIIAKSSTSHTAYGLQPATSDGLPAAAPDITLGDSEQQQLDAINYVRRRAAAEAAAAAAAEEAAAGDAAAAPDNDAAAAAGDENDTAAEQDIQAHQQPNHHHRKQTEKQIEQQHRRELTKLREVLRANTDVQEAIRQWWRWLTNFATEPGAQQVHPDDTAAETQPPSPEHPQPQQQASIASEASQGQPSPETGETGDDGMFGGDPPAASESSSSAAVAQPAGGDQDQTPGKQQGAPGGASGQGSGASEHGEKTRGGGPGAAETAAADAPKADRTLGIDQPTYMALVLAVAQVVLPQYGITVDPRYDPHEDWLYDSEGMAGMDSRRFFESMFDFADCWARGDGADQYVELLQSTIIAIQKLETGDGTFSQLLQAFRNPSISPVPGPQALTTPSAPADDLPQLHQPEPQPLQSPLDTPDGAAGSLPDPRLPSPSSTSAAATAGQTTASATAMLAPLAPPPSPPPAAPYGQVVFPHPATQSQLHPHAPPQLASALPRPSISPPPRRSNSRLGSVSTDFNFAGAGGGGSVGVTALGYWSGSSTGAGGPVRREQVPFKLPQFAPVDVSGIRSALSDYLKGSGGPPPRKQTALSASSYCSSAAAAAEERRRRAGRRDGSLPGATGHPIGTIPITPSALPLPSHVGPAGLPGTRDNLDGGVRMYEEYMHVLASRYLARQEKVLRATSASAAAAAGQLLAAAVASSSSGAAAPVPIVPGWGQPAGDGSSSGAADRRTGGGEEGAGGFAAVVGQGGAVASPRAADAEPGRTTGDGAPFHSQAAVPATLASPRGTAAGPPASPAAAAPALVPPPPLPPLSAPTIDLQLLDYMQPVCVVGHSVHAVQPEPGTGSVSVSGAISPGSSGSAGGAAASPPGSRTNKASHRRQYLAASGPGASWSTGAGSHSVPNTPIAAAGRAVPALLQPYSTGSPVPAHAQPPQHLPATSAGEAAMTLSGSSAATAQAHVVAEFAAAAYRLSDPNVHALLLPARPSPPNSFPYTPSSPTAASSAIGAVSRSLSSGPGGSPPFSPSGRRARPPTATTAGVTGPYMTPASASVERFSPYISPAAAAALSYMYPHLAAAENNNGGSTSSVGRGCGARSGGSGSNGPVAAWSGGLQTSASTDAAAVVAEAWPGSVPAAGCGRPDSGSGTGPAGGNGAPDHAHQQPQYRPQTSEGSRPQPHSSQTPDDPQQQQQQPQQHLISPAYAPAQPAAAVPPAVWGAQTSVSGSNTSSGGSCGPRWPSAPSAPGALSQTPRSSFSRGLGGAGHGSGSGGGGGGGGSVNRRISSGHSSSRRFSGSNSSAAGPIPATAGVGVLLPNAAMSNKLRNFYANSPISVITTEGAVVVPPVYGSAPLSAAGTPASMNAWSTSAGGCGVTPGDRSSEDLPAAPPSAPDGTYSLQHHAQPHLHAHAQQTPHPSYHMSMSADWNGISRRAAAESQPLSSSGGGPGCGTAGTGGHGGGGGGGGGGAIRSPVRIRSSEPVGFIDAVTTTRMNVAIMADELLQRQAEQRAHARMMRERGLHLRPSTATTRGALPQSFGAFLAARDATATATVAVAAPAGAGMGTMGKADTERRY